MEGIVLIDKPIGLSSFDVVRQLRKISSQKKIGHAGTLDPLASGLMLLCLGRYTKLIDIFLGQKKRYSTRIELGLSTASDDYEGDVLSRSEVPCFSTDKIAETLASFLGPQLQKAPLYSAKKIAGRPAYERARKGEDFEIKASPIEIYSIILKSYELPFIELEVDCSKGTYIRSLARDIGQKLGTGACTAAIRRLSSGSTEIADALSLQNLTKECLLEALSRSHAILAKFPLLELNEHEKTDLKNGKALRKRDSDQGDELIACYNKEPIALLDYRDGFFYVRRGI